MLVFLIWCCCGKKLRKSCWTITKYFTLQCFHQHKIINHCLVCAQHQVLMWFLSVVHWRTNREFRNMAKFFCCGCGVVIFYFIILWLKSVQKNGICFELQPWSAAVSADHLQAGAACSTAVTQKCDGPGFIIILDRESSKCFSARVINFLQWPRRKIVLWELTKIIPNNRSKQLENI